MSSTRCGASCRGSRCCPGAISSLSAGPARCSPTGASRRPISGFEPAGEGAMAESPLLAVEGVSAFYDQFRALDDIDIRVGAGEIVSIIGANGAGKSTLLKAIIGQADRVEGRILFAGENILGRATAAIVAAGIMLVPEGRRLFPSLTVEENLRLGWDVGRRGEFGFDAVWRLFPQLAERRRQKAASLSGGQQQMVALGRALLANPKLLLCDEISLGLAPIVIREIYEQLEGITANETTVILV